MQFQKSSKWLLGLLVVIMGGGVSWGQKVARPSDADQEGQRVTRQSDRNKLLAKISDLQAQIDALRRLIEQDET
ncbi:MAG: hypothetical protein ACHQKY_06900, partial [Terriglobia bacterium]